MSREKTSNYWQKIIYNLESSLSIVAFILLLILISVIYILIMTFVLIGMYILPTMESIAYKLYGYMSDIYYILKERIFGNYLQERKNNENKTSNNKRKKDKGKINSN